MKSVIVLNRSSGIYKSSFLVFVLLSILLINKSCIISGKNLDHFQHVKHKDSCETVRHTFNAINVVIEPDEHNKGIICGGACCTNKTEDDLIHRSAGNFDRLLHDHTKSLRGILEATASSIQNHLLELSRQSENKTLHIFSQVYRRMLPFSRQLISKLYTNIQIHLTSPTNVNLTQSVHDFFMNLFPVAYHQAIHLNSDGSTGDLYEDYIICLKNTYDDLQPFGDIPKEIEKALAQSVNAARVFTKSLEKAAEILAGTDDIDSSYLTPTCRVHLLKLSYCQECNGFSKYDSKPCYGYCLNVLRGCLAQYVGVLDIPWTNVAVALERLVTTSVQSDNGIVNTIKSLDIKLSEAIMRAMENGPNLEKKVKKTCGTPKLLPVKNEPVIEGRTVQPVTIKWATPPDAELLHFLSTIEKSRDFYSKIVDNLCEDDEYQRKDRHCWTGDHVGDYTQTVMSTGVDTQRYNPEVPLVQPSYSRVTKLNELVDELLKLRSTVINALSTDPRSYSDIQSDMARNDEEGSGGLRDEFDDDEYSQIHGSGYGSGDGPPTVTDSSKSNIQKTIPIKPSYAIRISISNRILQSLVIVNLIQQFNLISLIH